LLLLLIFTKIDHALKPFDTIKTKMQAQQGFEDKNMRKSFSIVFKTEGIKGFYRLNKRFTT